MYEDIGEIIIEKMNQIKISETRVSVNILFERYSVMALPNLFEAIDKINFSEFDKTTVYRYNKKGIFISYHVRVCKCGQRDCELNQKWLQHDIALEECSFLLIIFNKKKIKI